MPKKNACCLMPRARKSSRKKGALDLLILSCNWAFVTGGLVCYEAALQNIRVIAWVGPSSSLQIRGEVMVSDPQDIYLFLFFRNQAWGLAEMARYHASAQLPILLLRMQFSQSYICLPRALWLLPAHVAADLHLSQGSEPASHFCMILREFLTRTLVKVE